MKMIDKSALVAEIESKIEKYTKRGEESDAKRDGYGMFWGGVLSCLNEVRTLCDTLEVKEVDLEKDVRQILSLYYEGIKHYDDIIKEEREENGGSDLAIKIMDGVVDARELGIQYVIDKLKAQKGE